MRKKRKSRPSLTKEQLESIAAVRHQIQKDDPEAVIIDTIKRLEEKEELTSEEEKELSYCLAWIAKTDFMNDSSGYELLDQISKGKITLSENEEDAIENLIRDEPDDEDFDWDKPIYKLAEIMRGHKDKGKFQTYKQAYEYTAKHYTVKGQPITVKRLENNFYKAKSAGYLDPSDS